MTKVFYNYSGEKNQALIRERNISFEEVIAAIDNGGLLEVVEHHNQRVYPGQKIYVVLANDYVYLVPFVKCADGTIFLKTIIPSRKAKKIYVDNEVLNEE